MTKTENAAPSPLALEAETLGESIQRYQRPLIIGAIVVAAGIGGTYLMKRSADIKETRGMQALAAAEAVYGSGNAEAAQAELGKVVTRYAGTGAGTAAALLSAQLSFENGKVPEGIAVLDQAIGKAKAHQKAGLLALRAAGKATAGQAAEAAKDYEAASVAAQFRQEREQYQMEAARQHVSAGNIAAARKLYETIASLEDSSHASEARLRLGELTLKA
jgi:predicted negative regulator of RcsB-dependent stress response